MTRRRRNNAGFTLVELVIAVTAGSMLIAGLASALFLATSALDVPDHLSAMQEAADSTFAFADEVQQAIHVTEQTSTSVEFAVSDITGDGNTDVIKYEWSGTAGDPLQRTLNHGTPMIVAENVHNFDLEFQTRSKTENFGSGLSESSEQTLTEKTDGSATWDQPVSNGQGGGQYFTPNLPAGAVKWRVTKVQLQLKTAGGTNGSFAVRLQPATGSGLPTTEVLEQVVVAESTLSNTYSWEEFTFSTVTDILPAQSLCLCVVNQGTGTACKLQYLESGVALANHGYLYGDPGFWEIYTDQGARFKVKGTYHTANGIPDQSVSRKYLTGIRSTLQINNEGASRVETTTPLLNTPESLAALWAADFDQDPTGLDVDYKNDPDWKVVGGGSFATGQLSNGVWDVTQAIKSDPPNDFDKPTTISLRFKNTSVGGDGAVFQLNYDRSGNTHATVKAHLALQNDGTQTLTIYKMTDSSTDVPLVIEQGLLPNFVDLRLILDPTQDVLGVMINGVDRGDHDNVPFSNPGADRFAVLKESGSDAEFDYVSIRVSDNN